MLSLNIAKSHRRPHMIRSGRLTVDPAQRRAMLNTVPIDLSPLLMHLLETLARRPGQLVTRSELKRALWPCTERIDTERRLNTAMRALRAALADDADAPRYIATVRSQGYCWIAQPRPSRARRSALIAVTGFALLGLLHGPASAPQSLDMATTLRAQGAMEQWRRQPDGATASRAAELLRQAGAGGMDSPSVLAMKAELELGSAWRWSAAERDYSRALDMDPGNADARLGLAWLRSSQEKSQDALVLVGDMLRTGVLSGDRRASLGWLLIRTGRPDLAAEACGQDATASLNDLSCSHTALAALGRYSEAKVVAIRLMDRVGHSKAAIRQVAKQHPREAYQSFLTWRARHFLPAQAPWFEKAQVLADAGETASALDALTQSVENHEALAVKIASTPSFAALRGNAQFDRLVRAVGA
jgi:DNA-binding winged helix-turn-helix (wHTH) protein